MIKRSTNEDLPEILRLLVLMHEESRYNVFPLNIEKLTLFVKNMLNNPNSLVLSAYESTKIKGIFIGALAEMYFSDCLMSADYILYVEKESRRKKIGLNMIDIYIDWAKDKGANDITLSTSTGLSDNAIEIIASNHNMIKIGSTYKVVNNV